MYSNYKILKDQSLIIESHSGVMYLQNLKNFTDIQLKDPDYNPNYNVLIDVRDVDVKFNVNEINDYISYVKTHENIYGDRKEAILTDTSRQVAMASLYAGMQHLLRARIMVFSTIRSIIEWLAITHLDENEITTILDQFKNERFQV